MPRKSTEEAWNERSKFRAQYLKKHYSILVLREYHHLLQKWRNLPGGTSKGSIGVYGARSRKCGRMNAAPLVDNGVAVGAIAELDAVTEILGQKDCLTATPKRVPTPAAEVGARSNMDKYNSVNTDCRIKITRRSG